MYSILDIDLDYFNEIGHPTRRLEALLIWANCPVSVVVARHNHAFARWKRTLRARNTEPSHILHVDEHHDMMDEQKQTNIANFMFHAMRTWPRCRVHWLVENPIDSPAVWLDEESWHRVRRRFSLGPERPHSWPQPDIVSVCTSPGFVDPSLRARLLNIVRRFATRRSKGGDGEPTDPGDKQ